MEQLGTRLRLAYYDASDGPRVMIFGPLEADFYRLQELFVQLSQKPDKICELHEQAFVVPFGGTKITLISSGPMFGEKNIRQGIQRVKGSECPVFEWHQAAVEWDCLARLTEALVVNTSPGHQYLTHYPSEDAIVVVSKGEYSDDVLQED